MKERFLFLFFLFWVIPLQAGILDNIDPDDLQDAEEALTELAEELEENPPAPPPEGTPVPEGTITTTENEGTTTRTIKVPIRNENGQIEYVDVVITDDGTNQTVTVPGQGDITVITDEDGNQNLVITPEDLDGKNISCQKSALTSNKTTCTMTPLLIVDDGTVYSADEAVFTYEEGQNIAQIDIVSNNLVITNQDDQTTLTKDETQLGNAGITIIAEGEGVGGSTTGIIPGSGTVDNVKKADSFTIIAQTTTLVHTVTNPNDPNDKRVKFAVPAGVTTSMNITQGPEGDLSVTAIGQLNGAFTYDSDPFSDNKITATSNTGVGYNISYVENGDQANGTFVASTLGPGPDGGPANIVLTDTSNPGTTSTVSAEGTTSVIINQAIDKSSGEPVLGDTSFFIGSDKLTAVNQDDGKAPETLILEGASVSGVGNVNSETGQVKAVADKITYTDPNRSKTGTEAGLIGNVTAQVIANEHGNFATATADKAYLSNNGLSISADGNIQITSVALKEPNKKIDNQDVKRETYASADQITLKDGEKTTVFGGGISYYQADLADGSTFQQAGGDNGGLSDENYNITFTDGAVVTNKFDKEGKLTSSSVHAANVSGEDKKNGHHFSVQNTFTAIQRTGKTDEGVDITEIIHQSDSISASVKDDDKSNDIKIQGLTGSGVEADKIRYGRISFDSSEIKHGIKEDGTFDGKLTVNNASMFFYTDTTNPEHKFQEGIFSGEKVNYNTSDYALNVTAIGKNGKPGNFTLYYLEDGPETLIQVYGQDGARVNIQGNDKDGNYGDILFQTAQYYENDQFKTFLATEVSGTATTVDSDDKELMGNFDAARVAAYQSQDGNKTQFVFEDGRLIATDKGKLDTANLSAQSGFIDQTKEGGLETTIVQLGNGSLEGSIFDDGNQDITGSVTFDQFFGLSTSNPDGTRTSLLDGRNITLSGTQYEDGLSLSGSADRVFYYQDDEIKTGSIEGGRGINLSADGKDPGTTDRIVLEGLDAYGVETKSMKFASLDFDKATFTQGEKGNGDFDTRVNILGGSVIYYENTEDPNKTIREGTLGADSVEGQHQDYSLFLTAIGDDGTPGKFQIYFLEQGKERQVQIYGEDGKLVKFSGADKDGNYGDILARTVSAYENDQFRQFMATELQGTVTTFKPGEDGEHIVRGFNAARITGYQEKDGTFEGYVVENGTLFQQDLNNNSNLNLNTENATFTRTNFENTITSNIAAYNSSINYVEYNSGDETSNPKLEANIQLGSIIGQTVENNDGPSLSVIKVNDIKLLAIDYDNMIKVTGDVGEVNALDSNEVTVVEAKDLQDLKVESLDRDLNALFNGRRFLKVDNKDTNGNVTSSYLLVNDASAVVKGSEGDLSFDGKFNARVFEFVKDEVTGQSIILKADADFRATANQDTAIGKIPVKLSGAIKGENITTSSTSYSKRDGKIKGGTFTIHATSLQKLELEAKVGFIDLLSFNAEGENGESIHYAYEIDKTQGVLKLRGVYKNGDKLETKFLFFKIKSHKEGNDAVQALQLYLKGQDVNEHLSILRETASVKQVNDFFGVSEGGAITFTVGARDKGFALELLVVDERFAFTNDQSYLRFRNPTNSYGLKVKYIRENGDQWGIGATLTADSKIDVEGDLYAFGQKVESIPTTLNANISYLSGDGLLGVVAGVHAPLTSYLTDESALDPNAQFYDGGRRGHNGLGAHVSINRKFEDSELNFSAGLYNDFKEPAFAVTYRTTPEVLANLGRGVVNIFSGRDWSSGQTRTSRRSPSRTSTYRLQQIRHEQIRDAEIRELEAKRMTIIEEKVDAMIEYYKDKPGLVKVKRVLQIAKKYLTSPPDYSDHRKNIFDFNYKDRAHFAFYEPDEQRLKDLDNIMWAITENKIMIQLPIQHSSKESLRDIYLSRRNKEYLESLDELEKINDSGLNPCDYYQKLYMDHPELLSQ